jgi:hypothetical protein
MEAPKEFGILDNFRTRVMPVLGTSPAVMGQAMAAYVLCMIAKQPFIPEPVAPMSMKVRSFSLSLSVNHILKSLRVLSPRRCYCYLLNLFDYKNKLQILKKKKLSNLFLKQYRFLT